MHNFKKTFITSLIISTIFILTLLSLNKLTYYTYLKNYNTKLNSIATNLKTKYPNINTNTILEIINSESPSSNLFKEFSYDLKKDDLISENNSLYLKYSLIELAILLLFASLLILLYLRYNHKKNKEIKEIITLIDRINNHDYNLELDKMTEGELSVLKSAIYKITLTLREETDNTLKDKLELKKSLEDISHQIKTPLTSLLIYLDNLKDNPNLTNQEKLSYLHKMHHDIYNLKFLIESLLKLSKFDVNAITFKRSTTSLKSIIEESITNVSSLSDLKNINITLKGNLNTEIICDKNWQIEALTNILKNAIEHSIPNEIVEINCSNNKIYTSLIITNKGSTISKKDLKNIFQRFYKRANSKEDSIGIGLALAKSIIEEDNGKISVTSNNNLTSFIIKYYK